MKLNAVSGKCTQNQNLHKLYYLSINWDTLPDTCTMLLDSCYRAMIKENDNMF